MWEDAKAGERHGRTVRAWLLAVLRFAVTRDSDDRLAMLAAASEIDKLGVPHGSAGNFRFFHRTSVELCAAISDPRPDRDVILRRHLARMRDERMERAFAAVLELDGLREPGRTTADLRKRDRLWSALAVARSTTNKFS